jgi:hypothetical protein
VYWTLWEESLCLPKAVKDAFLEDSLTDVLAMKIADTKLTSVADAKMFVQTNIPKLVTGSSALMASGVYDRITAKLLLFSVGLPAPRDGKLAKLVRDVKIADKYKVPLVNLYHVGDTLKVLVRIPNISSEDASSKGALESILTLLHYTTGVKIENMMYHIDAELGDKIELEANHIALLDELTASAALPSGAFPGETLNFGKYKATLPTILATLHLLAKKQNYLRRRDPQGKEEVKVVSTQDLRSTFNIRVGLTDKSKSYGSMVVKSCLSVICSATNRTFPGGWIRSNRVLNEVKSDSGLLFKLGYAEKLPYLHKLQKVITTSVSIKPDGTRSLLDRSGKEYSEYSFLEFRSGTVLTAPFLDHTRTETMDSQSKRDPLTCKYEKTLNNFSDTKYHKTINSLNKAHALLLTVNKGNSKTKAIHYEIARNEFLHLSAKCPITDGLGGKHSNLSDLPKPVYEFCKKTYRFNSKSKRSADDLEQSSMELDDSTHEEESSHQSKMLPRAPQKGSVSSASAKDPGLKRSSSVRRGRGKKSK